MFQYSYAAYQFVFSRITFSLQKYHSMLDHIYTKIQQVGLHAIERDLSLNLLYWMTLMIPTAPSIANRFSLTGTPLTVFNQEHIDGIITSIAGPCTAKSTLTFDLNSGRLVLSYDYNEFLATASCATIINPKLFNNYLFAQPETLNIKVDARALMTAAAVALDVIVVSDLVEIVDLRENVLNSFTNPLELVSQYYHPDYPGN